MLTPTGYWIAFALESAFCATAALLAARRGTAPYLLLAWLVPTVLLVALGYLDWTAQSVKETSLTTYVLGGILTPLAAVAVVWAMRHKVARTIQWVAAGAASFAVNVGVVMAAYITGF